MILLSLACLVSLILFIAFETNALVEYGKLLKWKLPDLDNYLKITEAGSSIHYIKYLRGLHEDSFIFRLITCSICISVFISLGISLVTFNLLFFPVIEIGGLLGFFLLKVLVKYSS